MDNEKVLEILSSSTAPVSGEKLSRTLGVSRTAVWKVIESLRREGYEISSSTKLGYSLVSSPDTIREGALRVKVNTKYVGTNLSCLDTIDSTNTEIKRRSLSSVQNGLVVISDEQTGGRGRRGNSFSSPKGKGLYLSAVLTPKSKPSEVTNLTAWVAVAVCDAIESICGVNPKIKWTNDIILNGKKLCGILTELDIEAESGDVRYIVTGIGINCNHTVNDFDKSLSNIATSIAIETGKQVSRVDLAAAIITSLDKMMESFPTGREGYLNKYREKCITVGKDVKLVSPDGTYTEAFADSIDDDFSLVVKLKDGTKKTVTSGEVSVRGLLGYV